MLADADVNYNDELRADFQQYYGLNLDGMGVDYTHSHAASLCSQLPLTARLNVAKNPDAAWTEETVIMADVEYLLNVLVWQRTKDGQKGLNPPKYRETPKEKLTKQQRSQGIDLLLVDKVLGGLDG